MQDPVVLVWGLWVVGMGLINLRYSKSDRRFKKLFRPDTLSFKGYVFQFIWFGIALAAYLAITGA